MKRIHQMTARQWEAAFPDEDACKAYLSAYRWPEGIPCVRCGSKAVPKIGLEIRYWQCIRCGEPKDCFAVIEGTVFENTNIPLRHWFRVVHLLLTGRMDIAAAQIQRVLGFGSARPAWYMCRRIRAALADESFAKRMGIVEADGVSGARAKSWNEGKSGASRRGTGREMAPFIDGKAGYNVAAHDQPPFVQSGST